MYKGTVNIVGFEADTLVILLKNIAEWLEENPLVVIWDIFIDTGPTNVFARVTYDGNWR